MIWEYVNSYSKLLEWRELDSPLWVEARWPESGSLRGKASISELTEDKVTFEFGVANIGPGGSLSFPLKDAIGFLYGTPETVSPFETIGRDVSLFSEWLLLQSILEGVDLRINHLKPK